MHTSSEKLETALAEFLAEMHGGALHDDLTETPGRFLKQIKECLAGYQEDPKTHLKLFKNESFKDLIIVSQINFSSVCEHHLLPFYGTVNIGYLPKDKILGLSKFARIVDAFSKRLQVQERLTQQIADFIAQNLKSDLVLVSMSAKHTCMMVRGVSRPESVTETFTIVGDSNKHEQHVRHFQYTTSKAQS